MTTSMHRLQISLPEWQVQFLSDRAQRLGVSIAEVIRQMIQAETEATVGNVDSIWEIAGIVEDRGSLIEGVPVSERPDLYLVATQ